jgi:hypothetical protein
MTFRISLGSYVSRDTDRAGAQERTFQTQPLHNDKQHGATIRRPPARVRAGSLFPSGAALVEVNGIEPMTSCLQSRRSPN